MEQEIVYLQNIAGHAGKMFTLQMLLEYDLEDLRLREEL
jgi:hypothetical protein